MSTADELLAKAKKPAKLAMKYHPFYAGKIEMMPKCAIRSFYDFGIWYTPGVAAPCMDIYDNKDKVFEYTNKWNTVAVVTDGTRVLGLGNIGAEAGMPVMEGKSLLFKYLGGVDSYPICLATKDAEEIITAVKWIQPSFGGINLEDIEKPKCFYILDRLREEMDIPVWHDDQQGTATVVLTGIINALKIVGKKMDDATISMIGAGAANIRVAYVLMAAGVKPENIIMVDSKGILHQGRSDLEAQKEENRDKWEMCLKTNVEGRTGGIGEAMKDTDACVAMARSDPSTIKKEWVTDMSTDAIVFACANPLPEIWPWEATEAGAKIVATGRSDFEGYSQVNNSLGFPGIFRGVLDVKAKTITDQMCIVAAEELARCAEDKGIHEGYIIPTMDEWEVYPREATAVALEAIKQGHARVKLSRDEIFERASAIIKRAR
ncbi:MAG: malate dehydrogenase, partial [Nitrososphaeria archaeon]|nr:malate dehydrogenase [Nitrososphaeria archaeon]NIQ32187.1 malate dehydrogenase [Nitrososphaeria archaeon]